MVRRQHRKKLPDPLVRISAERAKAVLAEAGFSQRDAVRHLAKRGVTVQQQTLVHITKGRQLRCRASLREGLAAIAGIPSEWLGDELDLLDGWEGSVDLNGRALPNTPLGKALRAARDQFGLSQRPTAPRYQLIARRLERDMFGAPNGEGRPGRGRRHQAIRRALSLTFWRRWIMRDSAGGVIAQEDMDEFAVAMGNAIRLVLKAWTAGDATPPRLRARRLKNLLGGLEEMGREVERAARSESVELFAKFGREDSAPSTVIRPRAGERDRHL